jgi:hypothetical protein
MLNLKNKIMKKLFLLLISVFALASCSCGGNKYDKTESSDVVPVAHMSDEEYVSTISGFTCKKAEIEDNRMLVVAIDAISDTNYDNLAKQFLDDAKNNGVSDLKGCAVVDIKNCEFQQGAVVGKRIGEAFN